jgi:ankyrin repeat protein
MKNSKKILFILSILLINISIQSGHHDSLTHFKTIQDVIDLIEKQKKDSNYQGSSPLHFIADGSNENELSIAIELINQGADVNDQNNDKRESPLHIAAIWNNLSLVKVLIDAGADVNAQDEFGSTPLHNVALYDGKNKDESENNLEIAKLLIQNGADLSIQDEDNKTAAIIASEYNYHQLYNMIAEAIILNPVH